MEAKITLAIWEGLGKGNIAKTNRQPTRTEEEVIKIFGFKDKVDLRTAVNSGVFVKPDLCIHYSRTRIGYCWKLPTVKKEAIRLTKLGKDNINVF